jgi:hypothetical protein
MEGEAKKEGRKVKKEGRKEGEEGRNEEGRKEGRWRRKDGRTKGTSSNVSKMSCTSNVSRLVSRRASSISRDEPIEPVPRSVATADAAEDSGLRKVVRRSSQSGKCKNVSKKRPFSRGKCKNVSKKKPVSRKNTSKKGPVSWENGKMSVRKKSRQ